VSAHTKTQRYCSLHRVWFNACCWQCEEESNEGEMEDTPDEREQRRVETYREAQRDEERIERI